MDFGEFIKEQTWIFSKTYATKAPHEYCLKENCADKALFLSVVKFIKSRGFKAEFWRKENTYLYYDGYFYWTMDPDPNKVILINRCKQEDYKLIFLNTKKKEGDKGNVLQGK